MKIIDSVWYTLCDGTCIGIVTVDTGFEIKKYIGKGLGVSQEADELLIAQIGTPYFGSGINLKDR